MKLTDKEAVLAYKKLEKSEYGEYPEDSETRLNILKKLKENYPEPIAKLKAERAAGL